MRVFAFFASVALCSISTAQASVGSGWSVECDGTDCIVAQSAAAEDRTWLATIILDPDDTGGALAQVIVPSGVHLASGLFLGLDRRPLQAVWTVCARDTCRAQARLSAEDLTGWKKARQAELRYRPSISAPVIVFPLSLMGLTAALRKAEGSK